MSNDFNVRVDGGVTLVNRLNVPESYADGLAQLMVGFPITKLVFHSLLEPKQNDGTEVRKATQSLSIPTIAAIEMALLILSACKQNEQVLKTIIDDQIRARLTSLLEHVPQDISATNMPG